MKTGSINPADNKGIISESNRHNRRNSSRPTIKNTLKYSPVDTGTLTAGMWNVYEPVERVEKLVYSLKVRKAIVYKLKLAAMTGTIVSAG
jgi:hypothetical protein